MTKKEAIAWAVTQLEESFNYEYYPKEVNAKRAAQAMSILSGAKWIVKQRDDRYWVTRG